MSTENNTNLFQVLARGDVRISQVEQYAIMMVGLTRAGKSTTFNWTLDKPMIGAGDDEDDCHYINVVQHDKEAAQMSDSYTSVTLCPNVALLNLKQKISLLDMAGYKDKRDYIGVIGVSYFLKAVFQAAKHVKFIIVISEQKLMETEGSGVIATFQGFLRMFNMDELQPVKKQFYDSISLVITQSLNQIRHLKRFNAILKKVSHPQLQIQKKEHVINLIENIIAQNRIEAFPKAEISQPAPKADYIDRFKEKGWQFFNVHEYEQTTNKEFICLPFSHDFDLMQESSRKSFEDAMKKRVDSYVHFSKTLNSLIRSIENKWDSCIDTWRSDKILELNLDEYDSFFSAVQNFLEENDFYHSETLVKQDIKVQYKTPNLVGVIKKILELYNITDKIGEQSDEFIVNMKAYSTLFTEMISCMTSFARNKEQQLLLIRLKFIIQRGFREFSKIYQLRKNLIHDVNQKTKDNCSMIFEQHRPQFIERFIDVIDGQLLLQLFVKIDDLIEYEHFFTDYENDYQGINKKQFIYFSEKRLDIESAKAELYLIDRKKKKALHCYIRCFRILSEISFNASKSEKPTNEVEEDLNNYYMKKITIISKIISILKELPGEETNDYALSLCKYIGDVDETCEVYELIIKDTTKLHIKIDKLGEYSDFCLEWGRYEKATALLQKKLSLEKGNFNNYKSTMLKMTQVAKSQKRYMQKYEQNLQTWSRLPEGDTSQLHTCLDELEIVVPSDD